MSLSFYKLESFHWYIDYLWIIIIIFFYHEGLITTFHWKIAYSFLNKSSRTLTF